MTDQADLIERLETEAKRLDELEDGLPATAKHVHDHIRLRGKAEGVRLALSYVREGERITTDLTERAWGIIANVGNGDWSTQLPEWVAAAERWRYDLIAQVVDIVEATGR